MTDEMQTVQLRNFETPAITHNFDILNQRISPVYFIDQPKMKVPDAIVFTFTTMVLNKALFVDAFSARTGRFSIRGTALQSTMDINQSEVLKKQQLTKDALMKLLEKQRKEMQTTEDLIQNLSVNKNHVGTNVTTSDSSASAPAASSLAQSIYAAVDYGFLSRSEGSRAQSVDDLNNQLFKGYGPPSNIFSLGKRQLIRNINAIKGEYKDEKDVELTSKQKDLQNKLEKLTLNSTAIWEREEARGEIVAPYLIKIPYYVLCYFFDVVFEGKNVFSRFFLLETVARMPYFSYITMLHLYETIGFWRRSNEVKRVHFAEEWNEFHHLLIMESLGGDQSWWVRFVAQHSALVYFLVLTHLWALSPSLSYKFSEMLETHAVDTYSQFLDENENDLRELPPSLAAVEYYTLGISDPMLAEYQTTAQATGGEIRKPGMHMKSLFDAFSAIRADEGDHVGTMKACLDPNVAVLSPSLETRVLTGLALAASVGYFVSTGMLGDPASTEILESMDDTVITDTAIDVLSETVFDGLIGGVAALIQGLQSVEGEETVFEGLLGGVAALFQDLQSVEGETDIVNEVEDVAAVGGFSFLLTNLRQAIIPFFKLLRIL